MNIIDESFFKNRQKKRNYLHFDEKRSHAYLYDYVTHPSNITRHSFYPFISYNLIDKKIEKNYLHPKLVYKPVINSPRFISHSLYPFISYKKARKYAITTSKVRFISYASHFDSDIYAYYARLLEKPYEDYLAQNGLEDCALAYRKIERVQNNEVVSKCNIHFSRDVFSIISQRRNCVVLCYDVSKFFDSLNHEILKRNWCLLLNCHRLPDDHYKVYKSLTKFAYVDKKLLYKELGLSLNSRTLHKRHRVLCKPDDFRNRIRGKGLVNTNTSLEGIPQGSPLSGLLSNVYMMQFDISMNGYLKNIDGTYFRYSDDMIFIVNNKYESQLVHFIDKELEKLKLHINKTKTQRIVFKDGVVSFNTGNVSFNNPHKLQYLGLLYDGKQVFLRDTGLSKYNRKMRKAIRMRSAHFRRLKADNNLNGSTIYKRTLHSRFTYIGKRNYISYVFRVSEVHNSKNVKRQVKGHYKLFEEYLNARI